MLLFIHQITCKYSLNIQILVLYRNKIYSFKILMQRQKEKHAQKVEQEATEQLGSYLKQFHNPDAYSLNYEHADSDAIKEKWSKLEPEITHLLSNQGIIMLIVNRIKRWNTMLILLSKKIFNLYALKSQECLPLTDLFSMGGWSAMLQHCDRQELMEALEYAITTKNIDILDPYFDYVYNGMKNPADSQKWILLS